MNGHRLHRGQQGFTLTSLLIILFIVGALVLAAQRMGGSTGITTSEVSEATAINVALADGDKLKSATQLMLQRLDKAEIGGHALGANGLFSATGGRATWTTLDASLYESWVNPVGMRWNVAHASVPGVSRVLDAVAGTYEPSVVAMLSAVKPSVCQALNAKLLKNDPDGYDQAIPTVEITTVSADPLIYEASGADLRPVICVKAQSWGTHVLLYTLEP